MSTVAVFAFTSLNAQDESIGGFAKGDVYASGTVGYNSTKVADDNANQFTFSPAVGYFITENLALEAGLIIGSDENFSEDKSSSFGGSIGANYFFTPTEKFSFSLGAGFAYQSSKFEPNGGTESTFKGFAIAVSPGLNYFVSNNFSLSASVGALSYSSAKEDADGAESINNFGLNLNLSNINFGLIYKFK